MFPLRDGCRLGDRSPSRAAAGKIAAMEYQQAFLYRMAYGLAADLAEAGDGSENFPGRWRSNAAAGGPFAAILGEVRRRLETGRGEAPEGHPGCRRGRAGGAPAALVRKSKFTSGRAQENAAAHPDATEGRAAA